MTGKSIEDESDSEKSEEEYLNGTTELFQDPEGFYSKEKPATVDSYTLSSGETLVVRLVGHSPLWVCQFQAPDPLTCLTFDTGPSALEWCSAALTLPRATGAEVSRRPKCA